MKPTYLLQIIYLSTTIAFIPSPKEEILFLRLIISISVHLGDFYDQQPELFPGLKKINAFDWEEGFPEVFSRKGFDGVS